MNTCEIPVRVNQARILDYNGRYLLDLCQSTGLVIANGRTDYLLLSFSDFETLSHFDILEFNEHSDHAPVSFNMQLLCERTLENEEHECNNEIGRKIVWDNEKVGDFQSLLVNNNAHIQQFTSDVSTEPIDDVVKTFSQFLHDQAFDVFGKTYSHTKSTRHKRTDKKWFDAACRDAQCEFKAARNTFNCNKNDDTRIQFTRACTNYNRIKKKKTRQSFRMREGRRLNDLAKTEPRKFWKNIKKSYKKNNNKKTKQKKQKTNVEADSLTVQDLQGHFQSLFGEQYTDQVNSEPVLDQNIYHEVRFGIYCLRTSRSCVYTEE